MTPDTREILEDIASEMGATRAGEMTDEQLIEFITHE